MESQQEKIFKNNIPGEKKKKKKKKKGGGKIVTRIYQTKFK